MSREREQIRRAIGVHSCREVLKVRPKKIMKAILKNGYDQSRELDELAQLCRRHHIRIETQAIPFFEKLGSGHQGICLEVTETPELNWTKLKEAEVSCLVALDGIEDPHNFGAILRTSWLLGAHGLLVPGARQVGLTPTAIKVASGAAEHVPVDFQSSLVQPLKDLKELGYWVFGTSDKGSKSLWEFDLPKKIVWVFGAEDTGVRSSVLGICDDLITIPQIEKGPSYNASVAAAIVLAETRRQWKQ